ncbi:MAG: Na(+)-translocating NADH-quinone reductase subunit A [Bacteroidales bacterium]|jgi:Na+-transporting NADH:ubiquinone oxidoreductase subunit A|nr:Na(+)-translocating NADH-quinone reductase subunit A [Bacteroidales bacterium]
MADGVIKIKKCFDIRIKGKADGFLKSSVDLLTHCAVKPTDFKYFTPKLLVEEGNVVKAGTALFFDKNDERIVITSPVSGKVSAIVRGEKRRIEQIEIALDKIQVYERFFEEMPAFAGMTTTDIRDILLKSGLWAFIRQRPFNSIANPDNQPKMLVISAFDTAPLAPDYDVLLKGKNKEFQLGIDVLKKMLDVPMYLCLHQTMTVSNVFHYAKNVEKITFSGGHPAGNVGVQTAYIDPINKGDIVWHINPQDVATIGILFSKGIYDSSKIIAFAGSELKNAGYHKIYAGACIAKLVEKNLIGNAHPRFISGNILTGKQVAKNGYIGFYDHLVSVIPEGNKYEFLGWLMPGFRKFSFWRLFFSWLNVGGKYNLNTNYHGGKRAFIFTDKFSKVLPMDIMPVQLLKAILAEEIEEMVALGIYEVEPEDFALCEFIDPSKIEIQQIIQQGLNLVRNENI